MSLLGQFGADGVIVRSHSAPQQRRIIMLEDKARLYSDVAGCDSKADFIVNSDIVFSDKSKTTPRSGQHFFIDRIEGLRIKKLRREIDGSWILKSGNA